MTFFLQLAVSGVGLGMIYALIALGFVIILKCSKAFNIAQGQFVMFGGYLGYTFLVLLSMPVWAAIIAAIAMAVVMGLVIERFTLRPLLGKPPLAVVMMTIALAGVLDGVAIMVWGGDYVTYHDVLPKITLQLGSVSVPPSSLAGSHRVRDRGSHPHVHLPLHEDGAGNAGHRGGRAGNS